MEFMIYDWHSFGFRDCPRWRVAETNKQVEPRFFKTAKLARDWLTSQGYVFKPRIGCWGVPRD